MTQAKFLLRTNYFFVTFENFCSFVKNNEDEG